jgi:hypothetical protein
MDGQLARVAAAHERGTDAGTTKALALAAKQIATFSIFGTGRSLHVQIHAF